MRLTQRISKQSFFMGLIVLFPAYIELGTIILSAIFRFIILTFHLNIDQTIMNAYYNFAFDLILTFLAILVFKKEILSQWKNLKQRDKKDFFNNVLLGIPILYILSIVGNLLSMILSGTTSTSENQMVMETLIERAPIMMIIIVVISAPILEELIFRLLLFTGFYKWNRWLAYAMSAGLFGLLHVYQPMIDGNISEILMIFPYLFMGIGLCFIYEKSDNIFASMLCHGIINLISAVLILI